MGDPPRSKKRARTASASSKSQARMVPTPVGDTAMAAPHRTARLASADTWTRELYSELTRRVGHDVELGVVEDAFEFRFAPVDHGGGHCSDPYSSRVLQDAVRRSFVAFLEELLVECERLPGLDPCERMHGAVQWARRVCAQVCEQVIPLLIDRAASWQDLVAQMNALVDQATRASLQRARSRFEAQAHGMRTLQRVCAAVHDDRALEAFGILEDEGSILVTLLQTPPVPLLEEFRKMCVPYGELLTYLTVPHTGPQLSSAARQMSVTRWAQAHGSCVDQACVASLPHLRRTGAAPDAHGCWYGVGVVPVGSDIVRTAVATGGLGAAVRCPPMAHTHGLDGLALVATTTSESTALLAVRVVRALHAIVDSGALRPRYVRADALLALVSRFGSESKIERERLESAATLPNEGGGVSEGEDLGAWPVAPPPFTQQFRERVLLAEGVDRSLQRDYMVLAVLCDELACASADAVTTVSVRIVAQRLSNLPPQGGAITAMLHSHTPASLLQAVGHVMQKVLKNCVHDEWGETPTTEHLAASQAMRYGNLPRNAEGNRGITVGTRAARRLLFDRIETYLTLMRGNGDAFATHWFPSRSAKSHARRRRS